MIRINLLPIRQTQKQQTVQHQLLAAAGILVATLIACIVWVLLIRDTAAEKRAKIAEKTQELKQLDEIIGEVNEFTAKKTELEQKLEVIDNLKRGKTGPVRALDDLSSEIPTRVWLSKLVEKGGSLTIEGNAIHHEDVSAFMKSLQKSKYFKNIVLGYSKAMKPDKSGLVFYEFRITCSVDYAA